jgi:hypothetical protein
MKNTVRNLLVAGIAGISLVGAVTAFAGGPGCGGFGGPAGHGPGYSDFGPGMRGHGPGWGGPHQAAFAPEEMAGYQLDALKRSLRLQPEQEKSWANFASAVEAQAKRMGEIRDQVWTDSTRTMPERIDQAGKFAQERQRAFDAVGKTMKDLYDVLSPEQRRQLDRRGPWVRG